MLIFRGGGRVGNGRRSGRPYNLPNRISPLSPGVFLKRPRP
jgi:hypothetical protein